MSRLNPVFTAITDIDDSIILNAKKSRKKPLAIALAAAAAVLTLVGFTIAKRYGVSVNGESVFDYQLKVQSVTIPTREEMEALGAVNQISEYSCDWRTLPSNVFKSYGISPLMNDNFSEKEYDNHISVFYTIDGAFANAMFSYELTDKALDKDVEFWIFCMGKDDAGLTTNLIASNTDKECMETITLNDGSTGVIVEQFLGGFNTWSSSAEFSYNGIAYSLHIHDGDNEDMKQVLSDLGVL